MRDRFALPLSDTDLEEMRFYRPPAGSKEARDLQERRAALRGYLPSRRRSAESIAAPGLGTVAQFALDANGKEMSTTMALVRIMSALLRAKTWSVTSFSELARDAQSAERWNMLHPDEPARTSHVEHCLADAEITVAATDYVRAYPRLIAPFVPGEMVMLGTDGFCRSDTRASSRRFFEVDRYAIALSAPDRLAKREAISRTAVAQAIVRYNIETGDAPAWER